MVTVTHTWQNQKQPNISTFSDLETAQQYVECMQLFRTSKDPKTEKFIISENFNCGGDDTPTPVNKNVNQKC